MSNGTTILHSSDEISNNLKTLLFRGMGPQHKIGYFHNFARAQEQVQALLGKDHLEGVVAGADVVQIFIDLREHFRSKHIRVDTSINRIAGDEGILPF